MVLRTLYTRGGMLGLDLARLLCLPFKVIEEALGFLKHEKCIEVLGGDLIGRISYKFNLTELGRRRAQEAFKMCAYVGPAPVPLEDYVEQTYRQSVTSIDVSPESLRAAFSHLVVSEDLFNAVGPSIVSGKSVFIYGPPGNGKTSIAQADRQLHEHLRRRDLHPLRLPRRGQHHHRCTTAPSTRRARTTTTTASRTTRRPSAACSTPARSTSAGCEIKRPGHRHRRRAEPAACST